MTDEELIEKWRKEFYEPFSKNEWLENSCFESVAIGFFVANGCDPEKSWELYQKCIKLDIF